MSEPQFPLNVAMLSGASLSAGNRVEVALNGDGTYPRLWDDLRSAQESITLQLYYGARSHGQNSRADSARPCEGRRARLRAL